MKKYVLTVGLFDRETEKQEIATNAAKDKISDILINGNEVFAFTMIECSGVYKMQLTNHIVYEPSIRIEIASDESLNYIKIVSELKRELNQESIMIEISESNIMFN